MASSKSKVTEPETVSAQGLTVIHEESNARIDICFIHGFTGHPYRTWLEHHGEESHHGHDGLQHDSDDESSQGARKARKLQFGRSSRRSISRLVY
ncbi:hypothetical protein F5Y10DRAFT_239967 [Nemania abortiva]|nr:hypothetical protein F5Y10DRAFT_239967 [Nemania abortiva]